MNTQFCWFTRKCVSLIDTSILSTFPFLYIYIEVAWLQHCFIDHRASHATWACMVFANPDHHIQQFKLCFALKFWVKYSSESTLPLDKKISTWNKDLNQQKGVPVAKFTRKRFISRRKEKKKLDSMCELRKTITIDCFTPYVSKTSWNKAEISGTFAFIKTTWKVITYTIGSSEFTRFPCDLLLLDLCAGHDTFGNGMDHQGVSSGKLVDSIVNPTFR